MYSIKVGKPLGKRPNGRLGKRWEVEKVVRMESGWSWLRIVSNDTFWY